MINLLFAKSNISPRFRGLIQLFIGLFAYGLYAKFVMSESTVSSISGGWGNLIIPGLLFVVGYIGLLQLVVGRHDIDAWWIEIAAWQRFVFGLVILISAIIGPFYIIPYLFDYVMA